MRYKALLFCLVVILFFSIPVFGDENFLYHEINTVILVADTDKAADSILLWTEEKGGYLVYRSSDQLILRFPFGEVPGFRELLNIEAEQVVQFSPLVADLREEIMGLEAEIESRQEILTKNLEYLDKTDIEGTLAVEREILTLLSEIDARKGRLRLLTENRKNARATVGLSFMEQSIPENLDSSFGWINGINFYSFMEQGY